MAQITSDGGSRMILRFTYNVATVMTIGTAVVGLTVIKRQQEIVPTRPCGMTQITSLCCQWMSTALPSGYAVVMAIGAAVRRLAVIERCNHRSPYVGGMASLTQFRSHRMAGRFIGACANPVMTT